MSDLASKALGPVTRFPQEKTRCKPGHLATAAATSSGGCRAILESARALNVMVKGCLGSFRFQVHFSFAHVAQGNAAF